MTDYTAPAASTTGGAPVSKTKWIVQLIVGTVVFGNIITLILAILGLTKADTDLETANKYYKWGWIAYAICLALWLIVIIGYVVLVVAAVNSGDYTTY